MSWSRIFDRTSIAKINVIHLLLEVNCECLVNLNEVSCGLKTNITFLNWIYNAIYDLGGYRPNGNQGYRPNGNQGYRPGGAGGYRPYNSQTLKNPTTVYGQAGNRPGYYQVASAYASTSSNGRPLQVIYIKRVPSTRNRDLQELSDDSFYLQG